MVEIKLHNFLRTLVSGVEHKPATVGMTCERIWWFLRDVNTSKMGATDLRALVEGVEATCKETAERYAHPKDMDVPAETLKDNLQHLLDQERHDTTTIGSVCRVITDWLRDVETYGMTAQDLTEITATLRERCWDVAEEYE